MLRIADPVRNGGVEETRARILAAARELYASKGSRGTTTREVADRAGVNEATLFRHFRTKTQMLAAMLEFYSSYSKIPEILAWVATFPSIEEQLRALALAIIEQMKDREDLIRVSMAEELSNPEGLSCAWRGPSAVRNMLAAWFDERVREGELGGEPEWLARVFMSLMFSFVVARKIWADIDLPRERSVANLVEIFLNGARAQ